MQTIIQAPKYRYLITLKSPPKDKFIDSISRPIVRQHIKKTLSAKHAIFTDKTIEIWSDKTIKISALEQLQLHPVKTINYGQGILSAKQIK